MKEPTKPIRKELLDELVRGCKHEDMLGPNGLLKRLTGALVERMLEAEMTDLCRASKGKPCGKLARNGIGNRRCLRVVESTRAT